jgi:hypothetical protein
VGRMVHSVRIDHESTVHQNTPLTATPDVGRLVHMNNATGFQVGQKVFNDEAFTSPVGCYFRANTSFTVAIAGRSTMLVADLCGSVVWISDGMFLAQAKEVR